MADPEQQKIFILGHANHCSREAFFVGYQGFDKNRIAWKLSFEVFIDRGKSLEAEVQSIGAICGIQLRTVVRMHHSDINIYSRDRDALRGLSD